MKINKSLFFSSGEAANAEGSSESSAPSSSGKTAKTPTLRAVCAVMLWTLLAIGVYHGTTSVSEEALTASSFRLGQATQVVNENKGNHHRRLFHPGLRRRDNEEQANKKHVISLEVNPEIVVQALLANSDGGAATEGVSGRSLLRTALGHFERHLKKKKGKNKKKKGKDKKKKGKDKKKKKSSSSSSDEEEDDDDDAEDDTIVRVCDLAKIDQKELKKAYEELENGGEIVVEAKATIAPFKKQKVDVPIFVDMNELVVDEFTDKKGKKIVVYAGFQIPHPRFTGELLDAEITCKGKKKCEACAIVDTNPVGSATRRLQYNRELHQHQRRLVTRDLTEATTQAMTTSSSFIPPSSFSTSSSSFVPPSSFTTSATSSSTSSSSFVPPSSFTTSSTSSSTSSSFTPPSSFTTSSSFVPPSSSTMSSTTSSTTISTTTSSTTSTSTSTSAMDLIDSCSDDDDCSSNQFKKYCTLGTCYECSFADNVFSSDADEQCRMQNVGKPYCVSGQCCETTDCQPNGCSILKDEYECCTDAECTNGELCRSAEVNPALINQCEVPCFAPNAIVRSETRGTVMIQDLKVNERVLTASGAFKTVYTFQHYKPAKGASSPYLKIQTVNQTEIVLTDRHMIFVEGQKYPIEASHVKVGDKLLWHGYKQETAGTSLAMNQAHNDAEPMEVASIDTVHVDGGFSPITEDGTIIVDGFAASCFSNPPKEASEYVELNFGNGLLTNVLFLHRSVYTHMLMSPIRLMCMYVTDIPCRIQEGQESRIAGDALWKDMYDLTVAWGLESIALVLFAGLVSPFYLADLAIRHTLWSTLVLSMTASMFLPWILSRRKKPTNHC